MGHQFAGRGNRVGKANALQSAGELDFNGIDGGEAENSDAHAVDFAHNIGLEAMPGEAGLFVENVG